MRRWGRRVVAGAAGLLLTITGLTAADLATDGTEASASLAGFDPGNIISDTVFFNANTMTEASIQSFLNSKVPSCRPGYTCLKDFRQNTTSQGADAMCRSYSGGANESAARILYKVAQACGINPQVLIVTLQKEQGLITDSWPGSSQFKYAMGYACPDSGVCDSQYYGFFNQVYNAAWQFKRYANPPGTSNYFTWYGPKRTVNVLYNPDTRCGSSPVYIQNQATANLYYYTPYQPNQAALNAGYAASSDYCASYGNRNFYNYFTDWFGSTQGFAVASQVLPEYQSSSGDLGAPTSHAVVYNDGGVGQQFQYGSIYWSPTTGARAVVGDIRARYWELGSVGGRLGYPTSDLILYADGGRAQVFQGGSVYWGQSTGARDVSGPVRDLYWSLGSTVSRLGYPTSNPVSYSDGGVGQAFQNGSVYWSSRTGAHDISGALRDRYWAVDSVGGYLGYPTSSRVDSSDGGAAQTFENGSIYWSAATGAADVAGPVRDLYQSLGATEGSLGYPKGGPKTYGDGGQGQEFQEASIYWSSASGAHVVAGSIRSEYWRQGSAAGVLGYPVGDGITYSDGATGQAFQHGMIYWSEASGSRLVSPQIWSAYRALGIGEDGFGAPTSATVKYTDGGLAQVFAGGSIYWTSSTGAQPVRDAIRARYWAIGSVGGRMGYPTSPPIPYADGGRGQVFQGGSIYWSAETGAYEVAGAIRAKYWETGSVGGPLGYPTQAEQCDASRTSCKQVFQGGSIEWSASSGARVVGAGH